MNRVFHDTELTKRCLNMAILQCQQHVQFPRPELAHFIYHDECTKVKLLLNGKVNMFFQTCLSFILMLSCLSAFTQSLDSHTSPFIFSEISTKDGLPNAEILAMYHDSKGYMWIGTADGLFRYDAYNFQAFVPAPNDPTSISGNYISAIVEDFDGYIWLATRGGGLNKFDPVSETFTHFRHDPSDPNSISTDECHNLFIDSDSTLWITTFAKGFNRYDSKTESFTSFFIDSTFKTNTEAHVLNTVVHIVEDPIDRNVLWMCGNRSTLLEFHKDDHELIRHQFRISEQNNPITPTLSPIFLPTNPYELWMGTWPYGICSFNTQEKTWQRYPIDHHFAERDGISRKLLVKDEDEFWFGDGNIGLGIFNAKTHTYQLLDEFLDDQRVFWSTMTYDRQGRLWVGTFNQIKVLDPQLQLLSFHPMYPDTHDQGYSREYPYTVTSGIRMSNGEYILGTKEGYGAFRYDPQSLTTQYIPLDVDYQTEKFDVGDLLVDQEGIVWGTFWERKKHQLGIVTLNQESGKFEIFKEKQVEAILSRNAAGNRIASAYVGEFVEDCEGNLWFGTHRAGLLKFDKEQDSLIQFVSPPGDTLYLDERVAVNSIELNNDCSQLWISTPTYGVYVFDLETERMIQHFLPGQSEEGGLVVNGNIVDIEVDKHGLIWVATPAFGIQLIDPSQPTDQKMKLLTADTGLPTNNIHVIEKDQNGDMWLFSPGGISKYDYLTKSFSHIDELYGLHKPSVIATELSFGMLNNGEILIGQHKGFFTFHPDSLKPSPKNQPLVFTYLNIFDQEKKLASSLNDVDHIQLEFSERFFTIGFASLDYSPTKEVQYAYQLEGFQDEWFFADKQAFASFTNVPFGTYTFRVRTATPDGQLNQQEIQQTIIILPPWYQTWWAYTMWVLIAGLLLFTIFTYQKRRLQLKAQLESEQQEAARLKELDQVKSRLFTNITHELRTPLTVIRGINEESNASVADKDLIGRNANGLLDQINQILDLAKLESGAMGLHYVQEDILLFLRYLTYSFQSLANVKQINLSFYSPETEIVMDYDQEMIMRILSNLISNAIKFTPKYGHIFVEGRHIENQLQLTVRDSGIGIRKEEIPFIFDRFQQADNSSTRQAEGTGIGLALVKEIVELLGGKITVESIVGEGATFKIVLPIHHTAPLQQQHAFQETAIDQPTVNGMQPIELGQDSRLPNLLLAEDNLDMIAYLKQILQPHYQLMIAKNGEEAIELAIENIPDIVLTDVMMPKKDGFELSETLKSDERTSHIPIIILTAKADQISKESGLTKGADAYVAKPFEKNELLIRLNKLIESRQILQTKYQKIEIGQAQPDGELAAMDVQFLSKLDSIVRDNLTTEGFKVDPDLCRAIGMSRAQLHRKLKALLDMSPGEYIRKYRMKMAHQYLKDHKLTIADIALKVGYEDASNFTKVYAKEFGEVPSETRNRLI